MTLTLPRLTTSRLEIRPLTSDDAHSCHQLYTEIGWNDGQGSEADHFEQRRQWVEWSALNHVQLARLLQPPYGERAVIAAAAGFVGLVGLVPLLAPFAQLRSLGSDACARFTAEVGLFWAISPGAQRQGYATEAARALIDFALQELHLARIVATTEYDNLASIAVMQRLGMRIERNPHSDPPWFQVVGVLEAP
jgi:RimJ/RimL family protein N-acetyltransferase